MIPFIWNGIHRTGKSKEREIILVVPRAEVEVRERQGSKWLLMGTEILCGVIKNNVLQYSVVIVTPHYEYTKNHWTVCTFINRWIACSVIFKRYIF